MFERHLNGFVLVLTVVVLTITLALVAPMPIVCHAGPRVQVPWANSSTFVDGTETDLEIFVTADRRVFIGPTVIPPDQVASELYLIHLVHPRRRLLISADGAVPYGRVADMILAARYAGYDRLTFITFRGTPLEAAQREHAGGA